MRMILSSLALAAFVALPAFAQEANTSQTADTRIDVNAVLVDAVVTDAKGHQILGLDKADFVVKENGVAQELDSVDYFTNRKLLNAPGNQQLKAERVRGDRWFIVFFDKPSDNQLFDELVRVRHAADKFVDEQMLPGDRLAVVGHDVRLEVYSDFTSDKAQLHAALKSAVTFSRGIRQAPANAADGSLFKALDVHEMMDRTGTVYEALRVLADATRPIAARKTLLLFSAGILEHGQLINFGGIPSESRYYKPMIQALNSANVTVDAANLDTQSTRIDPIRHQTLEQITADTKGEYFRTVSFETPLKKAEQQSSGYYLLTYRTTKGRGESGYQKVDVSLRNPEFRIKARDGYRYGD